MRTKTHVPMRLDESQLVWWTKIMSMQVLVVCASSNCECVCEYILHDTYLCLWYCGNKNGNGDRHSSTKHKHKRLLHEPFPHHSTETNTTIVITPNTDWILIISFSNKFKYVPRFFLKVKFNVWLENLNWVLMLNMLV